MVSYSTPPRIYDASCFEDNNHTGENMTLKQSLITASDESLEDEGQTKLLEERESRRVICKRFLLGSSFGFALQAMSYAAHHTLFKMFGKDTKPTPGSLLSSFSYYLLVPISQLYLALYIAIMMTFLYTTTQSGSLYMRKKFDKDAANPNSGSIWTTRMLFFVGNGFLLGFLAGSFSLLAIVDVCIGMPMPLMPLFRAMIIDFAAFLFMVKCFDWSHHLSTSGCTIEQNLEDDSCLVSVV
jgi:hypothetical protein